MDALKDGAESVKDEIARRMRSPFFGAFVVAWCVVNYEFLVVVFSDGNYAERIGYIARHLSYGSDLLHSFGLPLLLASVSTLALPLVNLLANLWAHAVEVAGSHLNHFVETGRIRPDAELRELARRRKDELDQMRRYALGLIFRTGADSVRMFEGRQIEEIGEVRRLTGVTTPYVPLGGECVRVVEGVGLPVRGFQMLQTLQSAGTLHVDQLLREARFSVSDDPNPRILSLLYGLGLVRFIWLEGAEPSFELSRDGSLLLEVIAARYSEVFTQRYMDSER